MDLVLVRGAHMTCSGLMDTDNFGACYAMLSFGSLYKLTSIMVSCNGVAKYVDSYCRLMAYMSLELFNIDHTSAHSKIYDFTI